VKREKRRPNRAERRAIGTVSALAPTTIAVCASPAIYSDPDSCSAVTVATVRERPAAVDADT
jgi:hypothetical protein